MRHWRPLAFILAASLLAGCGGAQRQTRRRGSKQVAEPAPTWVSHVEVTSDRLCGLGVAGAAFDVNSRFPKELSEERAVRNLAGVLETVVQEAIIDRSTTHTQSIEMALVLHVDEGLIEQVADMAESDFWLDVDAVGPFKQENFTYAHSCIDAKVAAGAFNFDASKVRKKSSKKDPIGPQYVPSWIRRTGTQSGGRLCAVGFSLPTFHPDKTFVVVVEDVRAQLAHVLTTLVSSYYEELTTTRYQYVEAMTVATTQAISKGAIVTDFWYDRAGIGPFGRKRTTYGWGCVYPVDVMLKTIENVEDDLPQDIVAQVRERARNAFDELDAEIDKRDPQAQQPTPSPTAAMGDDPTP